MTHYSKEQKEAITLQYLNSNLSLRAFSDQQGIAKSTLYTWSRQLDINNTSPMKNSPLSAEQRFSIVLETAALSELELSQYCREKWTSQPLLET